MMGDFNCVLGILIITLGDSESHLNLLFQQTVPVCV